MRTTTKIKESAYSKTSKPFLNKRGASSFFSNSSKDSSPFFSPLTIQAKLAIGHTGDTYEQEAERVAEQIVSSPNQDKSIVSQITPLRSTFTQRKSLTHPTKGSSNQEQGRASSKLEHQINSSKGSGKRMDQSTKSKMNQSFSRDFGDVRIHTGQASIQMSRDLGARAFTVGNDIHFNQGEYNPNSLDGKKLLAHELTHTVQQKGLEHHVQRAPDYNGGTAGLHEDLTRQYSQETGVPYEPGLQYTKGYRLWLTSKNDAETEQTPKETSSEHSTKAKKQKKKLKTAINAATGTKTDKKGTSLAVSADAKLKIPLGDPFLDYFKFALKMGPFIKWQKSIHGPAKEKFEAGFKLQLNTLDFLAKEDNFSYTIGPYVASSGGFKTKDDKTKPFGSMHLGLTGNFIYTGKIWEANIYATGGYSLFGTKGEEPKSGAFVDTGASIYLRGNIGDKEHKILLGPILGGGYNADSSQKKSEGYFNLGIRGMF